MDKLVSSFLEIAIGETADTAQQFLKATNWNLEQAIQRFFSEDGATAAPSFNSPTLGNHAGNYDYRATIYRPPVTAAASYKAPPKKNNHARTWQRSNSTADVDPLAAMYRPPFDLMYNGSFEKAKDAGREQNKWLLVNLQSDGEFSSHMLNRDTWANEAVAKTIKTNFIFWQEYDDIEEGLKVCKYYKLDNLPVILVIDPITGQRIRSWQGMVQPVNLLDDLMSFIDVKPGEYLDMVQPEDLLLDLTSFTDGEYLSCTQQGHQQPHNQIEEDKELQQALATSKETNENPKKMSKSPWDNIGAWTSKAEEIEQVASAVTKAAAAPAGSFPSLKEAVSNPKQKKKTKMTLQEFTKQKKKTKMTLQEFMMQSGTGYGSGYAATQLTPEEMLRLPTGPKERSSEEMQYGGGGGRLGGGFSNYAGGGSRSMDLGSGSGRARDREGGSWSGGGNRRGCGGGFDDDRRGPTRGSDFDQQPSRADAVDNWALNKKPLAPSLDAGPARANRYGSLGTGAGGISRADGDDNWGATKKPFVVTPSPQPARSWGGQYSRQPELERWNRGGNHERQRMVLDPPKMEMGSENVVKLNKSNPFGTARPRGEVLAEKGLDWKKLDKEIEEKKEAGSRPTSAHSSRPGSSQSAWSEGPAALSGAPKPKVNLFGDWRKIDFKLDHRRVDRPETEEEKNLKDEMEQLKKEATQSVEYLSNLQNVINQKEDLEVLIRDLDDKVCLNQKPIQRPSSGSGRGTGLSDRSLSQAASYEDRRAGEQMDRPRSRGGGDAWAGPSDPMERPRSRGGVDAWARPNDQVERPRSRGGGDAWTRPSDERRSFQEGRGGCFGSRESDRPRSRKKQSYPDLPEEPKGDRSMLCRVAIRLPDGRRLQRNFLRTDSTKLLWSFCSTQLEEAETTPFRFTQAIPGASKFLEYDSNLIFEDSGLANSIITLAWE